MRFLERFLRFLFKPYRVPLFPLFIPGHPLPPIATRAQVAPPAIPIPPQKGPGALSTGPGPCAPGVRPAKIFYFFWSPKCPKKCPAGPGGPWGALGGPWGPYFPLFPPFFHPLGAPYFSFYTAVISPPISPLKAAALWGAPPAQFTLVTI